MAQKQRPEKSLNELRQEIAHSRDRLGRDLSGLGYELNFPLKLKKSFQRKSKVWVAGAVLIGLVLSIRRGGGRKKLTVTSTDAQQKKKGFLEAGLAMGALRLTTALLRPMVVSFVTKKLRGYATGAAGKRNW